MKRLLIKFLVLAVLFTATSCNKEKGDPEPESSGKKYALAFKSSSDGEPEFIVETNDLMSGEINASEGLEQIGWRYVYSAKKTLFSSGYTSENICASYAKNNAGKLDLKSQFVFDNSLNLFGTTEDESTLLAMEVISSGDAKNKLYFINPSTGSISNIKFVNNFHNEEEGTTGYPTALVVRDDKLYIPFIKYDEEGNFTNPVSDTAYVAVYSYPEIEFEKYIKDGRTGYIGVHGSTTGLVLTDNGDIYSSSSTSMVAGMSATDKPSGILRIKNGETEFDDSYFFNVEEAAGGGQVFRMHAIGDGKVFARLITNETPSAEGGTWTAYSRDAEAFVQKGVIIDLEAKTITEIKDLPLHAKRYTAPVYKEDGNLYLSIETAKDAYIYKVDIDKATAEKGAKIAGKTVKGIFAL